MLVHDSVIEGVVQREIADLRAAVLEELAQSEEYGTSTEEIARTLSERLPNRVRGRASSLRDDLINLMNSAVRERVEKQGDDAMNAFMRAQCDESIATAEYDPAPLAVASAMGSASPIRRFSAAAVVFVAGVAVAVFLPDGREDGPGVWKWLGIGVAAVASIVVGLLSGNGGVQPSAGLEAQVEAYLVSEQSRVEEWLFAQRRTFEACAAPMLG